MFPISPRLILILGSIAASLALFGAYTLKVRHDQAERDKAVVAEAVDGRERAEVTAKALDGHHARTNATNERASRAYIEVEKAPGASDLIDPDRRAILCAAAASVRGSPVCEEANADPGNLAGEVRGADNADAVPS